ncbi:DnaA/Hda family protein [Neorhodopirellula pilleata]|uniref:Chromosomal replication initiator protein DnaA n=1 Tax=Neorhodopirellula pilleata TaxID=2714738 RepID=A0A5C6AHJ6_9BACT|nr:DnaA/Hda family protein [Neorhodopirellula pilleata]TWT98937.1 Chromosomal replication initiator protein DnaA [Neorhodopirellula pilleata]
MSSTQGSIETQEAIGRFTDALRQRIGTDRFRLWFTHGVRFALEVGDDSDAVLLEVSGPFAADRIAKNFTSDLRASAIAALGDHARFRLEVAQATTQPDLLDGQSDLMDSYGDSYDDSDGTETASDMSAKSTRSKRAQAAKLTQGAKRTQATQGRATKRNANQLSSLLSQSTLAHDSIDGVHVNGSGSRSGKPKLTGSKVDSRRESDVATMPPLPESYPTGGRTLDSFLTGPCNEFAFSAATMAISTPEVATPLFLHGPTGTGKSHLLYAIAEEFRRRRRMRRVVLLTAEQFTNDFISSVNTTGLPAFRRRYREVDALLIDDVHFLAAKTATLREALYTVESLTAAGKPLVFTANLPPADIRGLTGEVAGRMASGLVCPLTMLDPATRFQLLQRLVKTRCVLDCDEELLREVSEAVGGDARAVTGVANMIGMLQRMYRREPTIDEVRRFGGDLLRNTRSAPSLRSIEKAVCEAFGIEAEGLRGKAQTKRVSEPRTLAMYLARQHTGSAFTEIAQHFGRRSHSGAIAAQQKVETWLSSGKPIGGGDAAMTAKEAIARVEARLRVG